MIIYNSIYKITINNSIKNVNINQNSYINYGLLSSQINSGRTFDGLNLLFIFINFFYHQSLSFKKLRSISYILIQTTGTIYNVFILLLYSILVFSIAFYVYFEQGFQIFSDLNNIIIFVMSISLGNNIPSNDAILQKYGFYYFYILLIMSYIFLNVVLISLINLLVGKVFLENDLEVKKLKKIN